MNLLMKNKWVQLTVFAIIVFIVGGLASYFITNSQTEEATPILGDRLVLTHPLSTGEGVGGRNQAGATRDEGDARIVLEILFRIVSASLSPEKRRLLPFCNARFIVAAILISSLDK